LHDVTARPRIEAKRAFGAVFKRLLDTAYATTHLIFTFTTDEQIYIEQLIAERFNAEAKKAGWSVRLEQFGPALPDILYKWDGFYFRPALSGAAYVQERWRRLGLASPPEIKLRLHHQSAKRNGVLVPAKQGPVISKPSDGIGWALEYRPVGGLRLVGDMSGIKLKRCEWLSDTFTALWLQGTVLGGASLWAIGNPEAPWAERPAYQKTLHHLASQRWDSVLRKRVFWQRFDQIFRWSVHEAEQREIRLRDYIESSDQPIYRKPYRPSFWNLRDYREETKLRFRSGSYVRADRQHGGPLRDILATPLATIESRLALYLLEWLTPPETQRLLERTIRLYKEDCWCPGTFGVRFDQSPSAYLYPAHAPKRTPRADVVKQRPARSYQRLLADQPAHNARWESYLNSVRPGRTLRERGSLNIPRETIEVRNKMIANLEHDFTARDGKVA
jgi:hypothetical protein